MSEPPQLSAPAVLRPCVFWLSREFTRFLLLPPPFPCSGPLFSFDVHDDIRLVNDATVEKDEVRAFSCLCVYLLGFTFSAPTVVVARGITFLCSIVL